MERGRLSATVLMCLLVLSLLAVSISIPVAADGEYTITIDGSVDTPTREVPVFGGKNISAIAKADVGESITVEVAAPSSSTSYTTVLINENQKTVDFVDMKGDDSGVYDLGSPRRPGYSTLDPGSYLFAVENSTTGAREKIHPLVIKGFDTSISAPGSATVGDEITVDVTVTRVNDSATNNYVEVVVADGEQNISKTATKDGSQYTASIDTSSLDTGSYKVYATVRGNEEVYGGEEVIYGISDEQSLSLESEDSQSTTEGSGGGPGGAPVAGTTASPATTSSATTSTGSPPQPDPTTAPSSDENTQSNTGNSGDSPERSPDTEATEGSGGETAASGTDVVTPNTQSSVTTETRLPGLGLGAVAVVWLMMIAMLQRRLR